MRLITYFLILLIPNIVSADATIDITSDQGNAAVYVKDQKVVFKSSDDTSSEAVFVATESNLYMINHENSSYTIMNEEKIAQLNQTIGSAMSAVEQQLQSLPPEQRAKMEQLLGVKMPEPAATATQSKLVAIGNKNYSGISCVESNIMQEALSIGKICLSNGNNLGLSSEDYNTLLQAQRFMFKLAQKAGSLASRFGHPIPNINSNSFSGLIIAGENTKEEELNTFQIINITQQANEISIELPDGYREQNLPESL